MLELFKTKIKTNSNFNKIALIDISNLLNYLFIFGPTFYNLAPTSKHISEFPRTIKVSGFREWPLVL